MRRDGLLPTAWTPRICLQTLLLAMLGHGGDGSASYSSSTDDLVLGNLFGGSSEKVV